MSDVLQRSHGQGYTASRPWPARVELSLCSIAPIGARLVFEPVFLSLKPLLIEVGAVKLSEIASVEGYPCSPLGFCEKIAKGRKHVLASFGGRSRARDGHGVRLGVKNKTKPLISLAQISYRP